MNKFLGIEITCLDNNSFELSQPFLIDWILNFLGLCNNEFETDASSTSTPVAKGILHRDLNGKGKSIHGSIAQLWACYLIYKTQAAQKSRWQCIRQLVFPTTLCSLTRNQ